MQHSIHPLQLPFEVHFESLDVICYEMMCLSTDQKNPRYDAIHITQGNAHGVTFRCDANSKVELWSVITSYHGEIISPSLSMLHEEDIDINHGSIRKISIEKNRIFISSHDHDEEEESELDSTGDAAIFYLFNDEQPSYLILDADGARIKTDLQGFAVDDDLARIPNAQRYFTPGDFDDDLIESADSWDLDEGLEEWLNSLPLLKQRNEKYFHVSGHFR